MRILVDGDACPVIKEILDHADDVEVCIFVDVNHAAGDPRGTWIIADQGRDSVDLKLVNNTRRGDIVVTQDYALAALALAKGACCLHQDGWRYTDANIDGLLASRYEAGKARRAGYRTKGPKKRGREQNVCFVESLKMLLNEMKMLQKQGKM